MKPGQPNTYNLCRLILIIQLLHGQVSVMISTWMR